MSKKIRPISVENFPNVETNCFGFAIGCTTSFSKDNVFKMNPILPIDTAFIYRLKKLGYTNLPRKISSIKEAKSNEYVFKVYGFKLRNLPFYKLFGIFPFIIPDYHVCRRELDGTWVHKPGWVVNPRKITEYDWAWINEVFGEKFSLFALKADEKE